MKKNRTALTVVLVIMTVALLGTTIYISTQLNDSSAPTQIRKTKASAQTYNKTVNLEDSFGEFEPTSSPTQPTLVPTVEKVQVVEPTSIPTLIAKAPTLVPTAVPTAVPTKTVVAPTVMPTTVPSPTLQPLLAYKSTTISQVPTLIPVTETGGQATPSKTPSPTKKAVPTIVDSLPESGWVQTSTILFIVASTTILFSLLF